MKPPSKRMRSPRALDWAGEVAELERRIEALKKERNAWKFAANMLYGHYEAKRRVHCAPCDDAYYKAIALAARRETDA